MTQQASYRAKFKYVEKVARKYSEKKERKDLSEIRLLDRALLFVPKSNRVLDVPCGGGRVTVHLAKKGYNVSAADISEGMIQVARENITKNNFNCSVEIQDLEKLSLADKSFDTIICFRLFHHLPTPKIRAQIVSELCRVTAKSVVISYFNPVSLTALERKFRAWRRGKPLEEFDTPLAEVAGYFRENGFQLVKDFAQRRLVHNLHLAVFAPHENS
jgi:2-polyprenyl-3-methyl-5-hydroxy-6-metoxy-1,4-benzoquinol methylase